MKNQIPTLKLVIGTIVIIGITTLINNIINFNHLDYKTFESWKSSTNGYPRTLSQESIEYSFYIIEIALFIFKGYLIYGIAQMFFILRNVEKQIYFSQKNIDLFKKMGHIFTTYVINVFILRAILSYIAKDKHFKMIQLLSNELILLLASGLGFYILVTIFEHAKALQEENDLTV